MQQTSFRVVVTLLAACLLLGCDAWYDVSGFRFVDGDRLTSNVRLVEDGQVRITASNLWASYPDNRYELGINTDLSMLNTGLREVRVDSILLAHYFRGLDISDSVRVRYSPPEQEVLPLTLCGNDTSPRCNSLRVTHYVNNRRLKFDISDTIDVKVDVWYTIEDETHHLSESLLKVYRRDRGLITP